MGEGRHGWRLEGHVYDDNESPFVRHAFCFDAFWVGWLVGWLHADL